MALTVNNSPFSASCNSYVSIAEADLYIADRIHDSTLASQWAALNTASKSRFLVNATRSIDMISEWIGDRYSRDQKLNWPRVNAVVDGYLVDQITFPEPVKEATIEMAVWSMANSGAVTVAQNAAFDSVRVGPIEIDFNEGSGLPAEKYFPEIVAYLLRSYGTLTDPQMPGSKSVRVSRIIRS